MFLCFVSFHILLLIFDIDIDKKPPNSIQILVYCAVYTHKKSKFLRSQSPSNLNHLLQKTCIVNPVCAGFTAGSEQLYSMS